MTKPSTRRLFLSATVLTAIAGCLGETNDDEADDENGADDDEAEDNGTGEEDTCEFEEGDWYGEGEPIETTVTLESEPEDDIEQVCAGAAADTTFDELNGQTDIELEDQNWIHAGWYFDGEYGASVRVEAEQDRHGNVLRCPDPDFEVSEARAVLPEEVDVTLHLEDPDETYECAHKIQFEAYTLHLD